MENKMARKLKRASHVLLLEVRLARNLMVATYK